MNTPRKVTFDFHFEAGLAWLNSGRDQQMHSPLMYAAFEFRMAVERFILELWVTLQDQYLDVKEVKKLTAKDIVEKMIEDYASPPPGMSKGERRKRLQRTLEFNRLLSEYFISVYNYPPKPLFVPNLRRMVRFWERLSRYCHAQEQPEVFESGDTDYVPNGYRLLEEVSVYFIDALRDNTIGGATLTSMPEEVLDLRARYVNGEVQAPSVLTSLDLMSPVLESRFRQKG